MLERGPDFCCERLRLLRLAAWLRGPVVLVGGAAYICNRVYWHENYLRCSWCQKMQLVIILLEFGVELSG
jgi:hypothetical protein